MKPFNTCPTCYCVVDAPGDYCHRCTQKLESKVIFRVCVWTMAIIMIGIMVAPKSCHGASVVTEEFLDRVAWIESSNNPKAIGKAGERSEYQLTPRAVIDAAKTLKRNDSFHVATARHARKYARHYLLLCERVLVNRLKRQPTEREVYAAYNRGPYRK